MHETIRSSSSRRPAPEYVLRASRHIVEVHTAVATRETECPSRQLRTRPTQRQCIQPHARVLHRQPLHPPKRISGAC